MSRETEPGPDANADVQSQVRLTLGRAARSLSFLNRIDRFLAPHVNAIVLGGSPIVVTVVDEPHLYLVNVDNGLFELVGRFLDSTERLPSESPLTWTVAEPEGEDAIRQLIEESISERASDRGRRTFVSRPVAAGASCILFVLEIVFREVAGTIECIDGLAVDNPRAPGSLLAAVCNEFLEACRTDIRRPGPEAGAAALVFDEGLAYREAASRLLSDSMASDAVLHSHNRLFEYVSIIAALPYEGSQASGAAVIGPEQYPGLVTFSRPVNFRKTRAFRKMLEITRAGHRLLANDAGAYGLEPLGREGAQPQSVIRFHGHSVWSLWRGDLEMYRVTAGSVEAPIKSFDAESLRHLLERVFSSSNIDAPAIVEAAALLIESGHGALLVICDDAVSEVNRLGSLGGRSLVQSALEAVVSVAAVDGAVFLGLDGRIAGFGVVIDGECVVSFDEGRGSRYNSVRRFIHGRRHRSQATVAVVISADGTVNVVPPPRPLIREEEVLNQIDRVSNFADDSADDPTVSPINLETLNLTLDWLREREFYLSAEQCERLNNAKNRLGPHLSSANEVHVFRPDEDFLRDLYLS